MADKKAFVLYKSWQPMIAAMKPEQAGELFQAIYAYQEDGSEPTADSPIFPAFCLMRAKFDEDNAGYEERCRKNREIAENREAARNSTNRHESSRNKTNRHESSRIVTDKDKDTDKDKEKDTGKEKGNKPPTGAHLINTFRREYERYAEIDEWT